MSQENTIHIEVDRQMKNGLVIDKEGTRCWYQNGELHRTDGPAVEWANRTVGWYQNGELHRTDGPAIEYPNGTRHWLQNNQYHRTDGPAVEYSNGDSYWYINDTEYSFEEYVDQIYPNNTKEKTLFILKWSS